MAQFQFTADDVDMLARTIYGEASGEAYAGQVAVANVVVNRFLTAQQITDLRFQFGRTLQGTMLAGNGDQFNCWRPSDSNYTRILNATNNDPAFVQARQIAYGVLTGQIADNTQGSDHYYNPKTSSPDWANDGVQKGSIGNHKFSKHYNVSLERDFSPNINMGSDPIPGMAPIPLMRPWHLSDDFELPRPRPDVRTTHDDIGLGTSWDEIQAFNPPMNDIGEKVEWAEMADMSFMDDIGEEIVWEDMEEFTIAEAFQQNYIEMTLDRGDTIVKLAMEQGIARSDIASFIEEFEELNTGVDADRVRAGATYKMPLFQKPAETSAVPQNLQKGELSQVFNPTEPSIVVPSQAYTHTVEKGQSLTRIADRLFPGNDDHADALKAKEIAEANNITNPNLIRPGDILTIPGMTPTL